jgi:hypothetical protein
MLKFLFWCSRWIDGCVFPARSFFRRDCRTNSHAEKGKGERKGDILLFLTIGQFAGNLAPWPELRASVGGMCYHVPNRGNGRARVYRQQCDYAAMVELMAEANQRLPPAEETGKVECPEWH